MRRNGLLVILRARQEAPLVEVVRSLIEAGVRAVEITLPTPGALDAVRILAAQAPPDVLIGAGTVLTAADVAVAADAGARFVVSPVFRPEIVTVARESGIGSLPGVFTPTEMAAAWDLGPSAVKLFPASALGPAFVSAVAAPLPDVPVVPTGGVALSDVEPYLDAGALGVAVGSPVLGDALSGGSLSALRSRARDFVAAAVRR
ncbi:2-dehydro-3-deoxyphosphogluconate aldolase [Amycolatopsis antarctica]|uniref:2-dehydro-3-deoxyphosphogluconate aldolase n=1 Tax=Amycolatopsis antarctica TaxID=1854586 RepID=A0A263CW25_9PSEU|nr:2-dehydro-3-deoxyphosphogluconate aldolase [Amycolatopsis antarctica]